MLATTQEEEVGHKKAWELSTWEKNNMSPLQGAGGHIMTGWQLDPI